MEEFTAIDVLTCYDKARHMDEAKRTGDKDRFYREKRELVDCIEASYEDNQSSLVEEFSEYLSMDF